MPGPLGETGRSLSSQSAEAVAFVAVSVTRMGYAGGWQVDISARCAPIRSSLSVSPLCKETIRWMHDPGVLAVRGVTCQRRGVRGDRLPVGSDLGPAGRGGHP